MEIRPSARYRLRNFLHSILLLAGMSLLLGLVGWSLAGQAGVLWAIFTGLLLLFLGPPFSVAMILKYYRASVIQPEQAPDLYTVLDWIAQRAGLEYLPQLYYVPEQSMNAFTLGSRDNVAIALSDSLLRKLSIREIAGVMAHEVSHIRNKDLWLMTVADIISRLTGLMAMAGYLLLIFYLPVVLFTQQHAPWMALLILILAPNLAALLQLALSRTREYNADLEAAEFTHDPMGLASALNKIEHYQGRWLERALFPANHRLDPSLLRSHPESAERIRRLQEVSQAQQGEARSDLNSSHLWLDKLQASKNSFFKS